MRDFILSNNIKIIEEKTLFMDGANRICYLIACYECGKSTYHPQYSVIRAIKNRTKNFFCSQKCSKLFVKTSNTINCENCNKTFEKRLSQIKKTKHNFCSKTCAARYQNSHKTYGLRRSKLEKFLEEKIKIHFPNEECLFNDIQTIGSELDIYFPKLKLAIQINGPVHFKPIYGKEKYLRIIELDEIKRIKCNNLNIILNEIDVSTDDSSDKVKNKRWLEISNLITSYK